MAMGTVFAIVIGVVFFIHIYCQVVLSILILRGDEHAERKWLQLAMVWLLPILGILFIGYFVVGSFEGARSKSLPSYALPLVLLFGSPMNRGDDAQESVDDSDSTTDSWTDI